jgi:hypothetical protein
VATITLTSRLRQGEFVQLGYRCEPRKGGFRFFVLLAASFFVGDVGDPTVHNPWELFLALIVAFITTILKFAAVHADPADPTRHR